MMRGNLVSPKNAARELEAERSVAVPRQDWLSGQQGTRAVNGLAHLGHGLASDPIAAFEVSLVLSEEDRATGQRMLLQDPGPLVKLPVQDVEVEVVDRLADVKRLLAVAAQRHVVPLRPVLQEATRLARGAAGSNDAVGRAEDLLHALGLDVEVAVGPLDDADGVDPQMPAPKGPRGNHCVLEGGGEIGHVDSMFVLSDIGPVRAKMRTISPWVRQGYVGTRVAGAGFPKPHATVAFAADVDEPGRKPSWHRGTSEALFMSVARVTIVKPLTKNFEMSWTLGFGELRKSNLHFYSRLQV